MTDEKEADWTKSIASETICRYFYILFFVVAAIAGVVVLADIYIATKNPRLGLLSALRVFPTLLIAILNALFFYIICARTLLK